ncbi:hypothetical protein JAAARDRAFT_200011 [Jaapia argillacea MUCL 33604]|uniref:Uncharacterized protein n=1 Tax=Jaapia argillacea MUCL 33604 TaxID=933084 RepID=A0A067P9J3_9AGAM|nr:hypothetical protein JAAARDRAFT_200011 [Jaapia argillacea MUCL 33604]
MDGCLPLANGVDCMFSLSPWPNGKPRSIEAFPWPSPTLPEKYKVANPRDYRRRDQVPLLIYGIECSTQEIMRYAKKYKLGPEEFWDSDNKLHVACVIEDVIRRLNKRTRYKIHFRFPVSRSGWTGVFGIYSNHRFVEEEMTEEEEEVDVFNILNEELGTIGRPPMWHWDAGNHWDPWYS